MNALWAIAVAARSFALSQSATRTPRRATPRPARSTAARLPAQPVGVAAADGTGVRDGNLTFECATANRVAETAGVVRVWPDGRIVSAEYSASHGPRSAGGPFPAVDDTASNVPQNPNYQWTRTLDVAAVAARYGLGDLTAAWTSPRPARRTTACGRTASGCRARG